jgi:hypothetical protein
MANQYIQGKYVLLYIWQGVEEPVVAGCNTSDTIQLDREFIEKTPIANQFRSYIPTFIGGTLGFDSVVFFAQESGRVSQSVFNAYILNKTLLNFSIRWSDGDDVEGFEGQCYVQSMSITGAIDEFATANINLLITGEITQYEAPT